MRAHSASTARDCAGRVRDRAAHGAGRDGRSGESEPRAGEAERLSVLCSDRAAEEGAGLGGRARRERAPIRSGARRSTAARSASRRSWSAASNALDVIRIGEGGGGGGGGGEGGGEGGGGDGGGGDGGGGEGGGERGGGDGAAASNLTHGWGAGSSSLADVEKRRGEVKRPSREALGSCMNVYE